MADMTGKDNRAICLHKSMYADKSNVGNDNGLALIGS